MNSLLLLQQCLSMSHFSVEVLVSSVIDFCRQVFYTIFVGIKQQIDDKNLYGGTRARSVTFIKKVRHSSIEGE